MASGVQKLVNKVKSGAREIADSLTPTLKVSSSWDVTFTPESVVVFIAGVKVQGEWYDHTWWIRGSWRPPGVPLSYLELVMGNIKACNMQEYKKASF